MEALFLHQTLKEVNASSFAGEGMPGHSLGSRVFQDLFYDVLSRQMSRDNPSGLGQELYDQLKGTQGFPSPADKGSKEMLKGASHD